MNRGIYIYGFWMILGIVVGTFAVSRFDSRTLSQFDTSPIESALRQGTLKLGSNISFQVKPRYFLSTTDANRTRWTESFYDDKNRMCWILACDGKLCALRQITAHGPEWVFRDDQKVAAYFRLEGIQKE